MLRYRQIYIIAFRQAMSAYITAAQEQDNDQFLIHFCHQVVWTHCAYFGSPVVERLTL